MKELEFSLKGNRTYIHGSDIFNSMYQFFRDEFGGFPEYSHLSVRRMATNQLILRKSKISDQPLMSSFDAATPEFKVKYYLYESDKAVVSKRDYDEKDIVRNSQINVPEKIGLIQNYDRYTLSEISIAVFKALCNAVISDSVKWTMVDILFTSEIALYTTAEIKIVLEKNIGTKMVVGSIHINNCQVGRLKFSSK